MRLKEGVSLDGIDLNAVWPILLNANMLWRSHDQELVITSGTEGVHSKNSRHYDGCALDFRSLGILRVVNMVMKMEGRIIMRLFLVMGFLIRLLEGRQKKVI